MSPDRSRPRLSTPGRRDDGDGESDPLRNRGQTALPALAVALLVLTTVTALGLAVADGALAGAERDASERRLASSLAERIVSVESPLTERANVLNASRVDRLDGAELERSFPAVDGYAVRVVVDGSTAAEVGDPAGGTTFRRLAVVEAGQTRTVRPTLGFDRVVTLPRRTGRASVRIDPPADATVTTVRANERVVLRNRTGLNGEFDVSLSRYATAEFRFEATGRLPAGSVTVRYRAPRTTKTTVVVTVDG